MAKRKSKQEVVKDWLQSVNKDWWFVLGVSMLTLIALFVSSGRVSSAQTQLSQAEEQVRTLSNEVDTLAFSKQKSEDEVIYQTTGVSPALIREEQKLARDYFEPAFTWNNGETYTALRREYMDDLGAESQFLQVFMPENIMSDDGEMNYIDLNSLKSGFDSISVYPIRQNDDDSHQYVAIITYYTYTDDGDLDNRSLMTPSRAVVEYKMKDSKISDVVVWQ